MRDWTARVLMGTRGHRRVERLERLEDFIKDVDGPSLSALDLRTTRMEDDSFEEEEACCTICFGEFTEEDPRASEADATGHGIIFRCGHGPRLHLSCLLLEAQQNRPFQCPLCRMRFGFSKMCICGGELEEITSSLPIPEYDGHGIQCDHCHRSVPLGQKVYHCPRGKIEQHADGFDVCGRCASGGSKPKRRARSLRMDPDRVGLLAAASREVERRRRAPSSPAERPRVSGRSSRPSQTSSRRSSEGSSLPPRISSNFGQTMEAVMRRDQWQRAAQNRSRPSGPNATRPWRF